MLKNKKAQQFVWIFSIIIGAIILFLAVYSAGKYMQTAKFKEEAELERQFDILLTPFAAIGEIATMTLSKEVKMPADIELNFECSAIEDFEQIDVKTGKAEEREGPSYKIRGKYVFAESLKGKEFWIFAKPLELPWRIDDMIYIVSEEYCFPDPPENIKKEISDLGSEKLRLDCSEESIVVCFEKRSGCDVYVNYDQGIVRKQGKVLFFAEDALLYGAIFSSAQVYECNVERLMKRLSIQIELNLAAAKKLEEKGCSTGALQSSLNVMKDVVEKRPLLFENIKYISDEAKQNNPIECLVF